MNIHIFDLNCRFDTPSVCHLVDIHHDSHLLLHCQFDSVSDPFKVYATLQHGQRYSNEEQAFCIPARWRCGICNTYSEYRGTRIRYDPSALCLIILKRQIISI